MALGRLEDVLRLVERQGAPLRWFGRLWHLGHSGDIPGDLAPALSHRERLAEIGLHPDNGPLAATSCRHLVEHPLDVLGREVAQPLHAERRHDPFLDRPACVVDRVRRLLTGSGFRLESAEPPRQEWSESIGVAGRQTFGDRRLERNELVLARLACLPRHEPSRTIGQRDGAPVKPALGPCRCCPRCCRGASPWSGSFLRSLFRCWRLVSRHARARWVSKQAAFSSLLDIFRCHGAAHLPTVLHGFGRRQFGAQCAPVDLRDLFVMRIRPAPTLRP